MGVVKSPEAYLAGRMDREAPVSTTKLIEMLLIIAATSNSGGPVAAMTARWSSFPVVSVKVMMDETMGSLYSVVC